MIPLHKRKQIRRPLSRVFPKTHPRAGEETNFVELISDEIKVHTIRDNYEKWKEIVELVNAGTHVLVLYNWKGEPYKSKQIDVIRYYDLGIQKLCCSNGIDKMFVDHDGFNFTDIDLASIAENDGLDIFDFMMWFEKSIKNSPKAIIHFTDFRY